MLRLSTPYGDPVTCCAGIMGELTHGTADIAAFPITLVPGRPADIDITYSYVSGVCGYLPAATFSA